MSKFMDKGLGKVVASGMFSPRGIQIDDIIAEICHAAQDFGPLFSFMSQSQIRFHLNLPFLAPEYLNASPKKPIYKPIAAA